MLKVIVDRKGRLRGKGPSELRSQYTGKMCCVGFACLAAGMSESDIAGKLTVIPANFERVGIPEELEPLMTKAGFSTPGAHNLYTINDYTEYEDSNREALIKRLGTEVGLDFEFAG